jgi:hypothetical protein
MVEYATRVDEARILKYRIMVGKSRGKRRLSVLRRWRDDDIKMCLMEIGFEMDETGLRLCSGGLCY